ncbi:hypothetical protein F4775DRAFT_587566 [Biscogniauxia sp. FL1348]|nr:hypothetical protein F4775DRAFT_587566 [Biscogniauxia sp. FL1348]
MADNGAPEAWEPSEVHRKYMENGLKLARLFTLAALGREHRASIPSDDGASTWEICWHENPVGLTANNIVEHQWVPVEFVVNAVDTIVAFFDGTPSLENNGGGSGGYVAGITPPVSRGFTWLTGPGNEDFLEAILLERHFTLAETQYILIMDITNVMLPNQDLPGQFYTYRPPLQGIIRSATQIASYTLHDFMRIRQSELWPEFVKQRGHLSPELFMPLIEYEERYLDLGTIEIQGQVPLAADGVHTETITISQIAQRNGYGEAWAIAWCCRNTAYDEEQIKSMKALMSVLRHAGSHRVHIFAAVRTITSVTPPSDATPAGHSPLDTEAPLPPLRHRPYKKTTATQIIGTGLVHLNAGIATLHAVSVRPEFSGRGVGSALVRYAQRLAREEGFFQMTVTTGSRVAAGFFHPLGFEICAGAVNRWEYSPEHAAAARAQAQAQGAAATPPGRVAPSRVVELGVGLIAPQGCGRRDGNGRIIPRFQTKEAGTAPIPPPPPTDREGNVIKFDYEVDEYKMDDEDEDL